MSNPNTTAECSLSVKEVGRETDVWRYSYGRKSYWTPHIKLRKTYISLLGSGSDRYQRFERTYYLHSPSSTLSREAAGSSEFLLHIYQNTPAVRTSDLKREKCCIPQKQFVRDVPRTWTSVMLSRRYSLQLLAQAAQNASVPSSLLKKKHTFIWERLTCQTVSKPMLPVYKSKLRIATMTEDVAATSTSPSLE
jgi:hypothetical protein